MTFDLNSVIIGLSKIKGVGKAKIRKIIEQIENQKIEFDELKNLIQNKYQNIDLNYLENFINEAKIVIEKSFDQSISIINFKNKNFPQSLNIIKNPPNIIFVKGPENILQNEKKNIAVIGTRNPSQQGSEIAFRVAQHLTKKGFNIISGLALGCDTQAHKGCLSEKGLTVAVLPGGLNNIYPKSNQSLAMEIIEKGGVLISEYLPNEESETYKFIERDRIQSGLSKEIILIESDLNGGSMKTVAFAKEQNKTVRVFQPTNFSQCSMGNKKLITENYLTFDQNMKDI